MAVDLATAFIRIVPKTEGMQKSIAQAFKDMGKLGESAGTDLAGGLEKTLTKGVKGAGKPVGADLGKEIDSALQKAVKGAGSDAGKSVSSEFDKSAGSGAEKAGKTFGSKFAGALKGINFGVFAGVGMQAVQALTGGLSSLVSEAANASDATDKFKQTMDFAGLDTGAIDQATKAAKVYADQTVYELADIQNMTAQLAANGIKDYTALGQAAGNLNAVAGGNAETFKSVGMVMTQTAGAGKLTTENWNQLSDAIPGASGRLQDALREAGAFTGDFRDAMAKGEITAEEFNAAVMKIGSEPVAVEAAKSTATFEGMIGNLQAALSGGLADGFNILKPHLEVFVNGLTTAAETVIPALASALGSVVSGLSAFGSWVQQNSTWLIPLGAALGVATAGFAALALQQSIMAAGGFLAWLKSAAALTKLYAVVTKVAAGVQAAFNLVMSANPIARVIIVVAAVVAALVAFFTKTETGRALWASFTEFLGTCWENIKMFFADGWAWISEVFTGIGTKIEEVKGFFSGLGESLSAGWTAAVELVKLAWESFTSWIGETWATISTAFSIGWETVKAAFFDVWNTAVEGLRSGWESFTSWIGETWATIQSVFSTAWAALQSGFFAVWNAEVASVQAAWSAVSAGLAAAWEMVKNAFSSAWQFINAVVFQPFKAAFSLVRAVFSGDTDQMKAAFNLFKSAIHTAIETIKQRLSTMVDSFRQIPSKIKSAFANAGSWLLDAGKSIIRGLADGIRNAGSMIADAVRAVVPDSMERFVPGLHFGGIIPAFARGGVLPDVPGVSHSQRDPILGWSSERKQPVARVEPGEFIVNREATAKYLPLLAAINGGRLDGRKGDLGLPGYANGGVVSAKQMIDFALGKSVNGYQAARPLQGAPYVFGGSNWGDCSGTTSAFAALAVGQNPFPRKYATMSQGAWLSSNGYSSGIGPKKNSYAVSFYNGGPGGGHTAASIFDANGKETSVEMGGSPSEGHLNTGVGAGHSMFTDRFHIPLKAATDAITSVLGTSVDGMTVETTSDSGKTERKTIDWGAASSLVDEYKKDKERRGKLAKFSAGIFDTGGLLKPGNFAFNASGKPERILNPGLTKAFEKLADVSPRLAAAMEKYVGFAAQQVRSVQGGSIQAYLGSLSATESVSLADSLGGLIGIDGINSTFGGVAKAWEGMEDAAIGQVDAADALKQAEKNLAEARASGDVQAVTAAEADYADALGAVKMAAKAAGQAQVAMAIEMAETVIKVAKWISEKVQAVFAAQAKAWDAVADAMKSIGDLNVAVLKLRENVAGLVIDQAMAQIELAAAMRNVRMAQLDGVRAQLEGQKTVAEAQAAFDAQRKADMRLATMNYQDLSLAYDRFRWAMAAGNKDAMDQMAAWSDKSHALYAELMAAQVGQQLAEKEAQQARLEATYKATLAALDLQDVTANLQVASQKLAAMSSTGFGMGQVGATVGQRYAELMAEKAKLQADSASWKTWLNPVNWFTTMPANQRRISQIDQQLKALEARPEFKELNQGSRREIEKAVNSAGVMGFFGAGDKVEQMIKNSPLGDAGRALEEMNFENSLIDLKASESELRRKLERGLAEVEHRKKLDPLGTEIEGLKQEQDSHKTWAEYWRTDNEEIRKSLAALAKHQADAATELKAMAKEPNKVVQISGDVFSADQLEAAMRELGVRVERLERPGGAKRVVESRR